MYMYTCDLAWISACLNLPWNATLRYMHTHICIANTYDHIPKNMCIHMHIYINLCISIYMYIRVYI